MSREWERYGRTLVGSMAEVLNETDPESHPVLLETADYWLALGLTIGVERSDEAAQLLDLIDRCIGADRQIDRRVQLVLVLEALVDALGQKLK